MEITKTAWWIIGGAGVAGLGVGIYFFMKRRKSKEEDFIMESSSNTTRPVTISSGGRATPVEEPNWNAPFDMNYLSDVKRWLKGKSIKELPIATAKKFARILKDAKGIFDDDERAVAGVFRSLQDKTQVAALSKVFYGMYRMDMYSYLKEFLSTSEMKSLVKDPVRKLPNYRLG